MERFQPSLIGQRNARLLNEMMQGEENAHVSGDAYGTNTGAISASRLPFGQVVSQDSFPTTEFSVPVVLVKAGPNGEDDFTDGRYWAREIYPKQTDPSTANGVVEIWINGSGFWGAIYHLPEVTSGSHSLSTFDAGASTDDQKVTGSPTMMRVDLMDGVAAGSGGSVADLGPADQPDPATGDQLFVGATSIGTALYRITAVTGSFPTWSYTVQRVIRFDSSLVGAARWVTDGNDKTAINRGEFAPPSGTYPYTYGNGSNITASDGAVDTGECVIIPIGVGTVVDLTTGRDSYDDSALYSFCQMNGAEVP
jgi:hypothetical protein